MIKVFRFKKLDRVIEQRRERLYRLAFSWSHDAMLADDLVQDTLSKAIQKQKQLSEDNKLDAWLFRILHNTWMEYLRRAKPTLDIDETEQQDETTPEELLSNQQLVQKVHRAIESLPMAQRQVITLVDLEGCSYLEVSAILDIPMGTVMSRVNRAREKLKKTLIGLRKPLHVTTTKMNQVNYLKRVK